MSIKNLFPLLDKEDIELRVGQKSKDGSKMTLLLYKNARTDAYYLDNVVGVENWTCRYYECNGLTICSVGINFNGTWVFKDDTGSESNVEKEKGLCSDAFKRSCFKFGLGRELYSAPQIWVDSNVNTFNLEVSHIAYNSSREIQELEIKDTKANKVVFSWRNTKPIAQRKDFEQYSLKQERLENAVDNKPTATSNEKTIVKGITDEQKAKLYQYLGSLTEEKQKTWYDYISRKYNVDKIDDLGNGDAQTLIDYIYSK